MLCRQAMRRMRYSDLYGGLETWRAWSVARKQALYRLRVAANRFRSYSLRSDLSSAFCCWAAAWWDEHLAKKIRAAEEAAAERASLAARAAYEKEVFDLRVAEMSRLSLAEAAAIEAGARAAAAVSTLAAEREEVAAARAEREDMAGIRAELEAAKEEAAAARADAASARADAERAKADADTARAEARTAHEEAIALVKTARESAAGDAAELAVVRAMADAAQQKAAKELSDLNEQFAEQLAARDEELAQARRQAVEATLEAAAAKEEARNTREEAEAAVVEALASAAKARLWAAEEAAGRKAAEEAAAASIAEAKSPPKAKRGCFIPGLNDLACVGRDGKAMPPTPPEFKFGLPSLQKDSPANSPGGTGRPGGGHRGVG